MTSSNATAVVAATEILPIGATEPVSATLPAVLARLVEQVRPERVILFGSYADGRPTPDSDVDLLVIVNSDRPYRDRYRWVAETLCPRPFPIDLLVLTPAELQTRLTNGNQFFTEVVRRGQVLYQRPT